VGAPHWRSIDAAPAVLTLAWPEGAATPLVEDLVDQARRLHAGVR